MGTGMQAHDHAWCISFPRSIHACGHNQRSEAHASCPHDPLFTNFKSSARWLSSGCVPQCCTALHRNSAQPSTACLSRGAQRTSWCTATCRMQRMVCMSRHTAAWNAKKMCQRYCAPFSWLSTHCTAGWYD